MSLWIQPVFVRALVVGLLHNRWCIRKEGRMCTLYDIYEHGVFVYLINEENYVAVEQSLLLRDYFWHDSMNLARLLDWFALKTKVP